jgi:hypothetical protein
MFKRKDVIFILWLTFITVVAWIGFNIYHITATSTISEELQLQIMPIDPSFDSKTIDKLKSRDRVDPLYEFPSDNEASNSPRDSTPNINQTPSIIPETDDEP